MDETPIFFEKLESTSELKEIKKFNISTFGNDKNRFTIGGNGDKYLL